MRDASAQEVMYKQEAGNRAKILCVYRRVVVPSLLQGSPGVDEFGRQRGSVGDLAPKSELAHDLRGNVIPVFDKA